MIDYARNFDEIFYNKMIGNFFPARYHLEIIRILFQIIPQTNLIALFRTASSLTTQPTLFLKSHLKYLQGFQEIGGIIHSLKIPEN